MAARPLLFLSAAFMLAAVCSRDWSLRAACHLGVLGLAILQTLYLLCLESPSWEILWAGLLLAGVYSPAGLLLLWQEKV